MSLYEDKLFIFDLDNTLYRLRGGSFSSSPLQSKIREKKIEFIRKNTARNRSEARELLENYRTLYGEDTSIAVEEDLGIGRDRYFEYVWDLEPEDFVETLSRESYERLRKLSQEKVILTNSPIIWTEGCLKFLGLEDCFKEIFTGEEKVKPKKSAFIQVLESEGYKPRDAVSIGDQPETEIKPANQLGLFTVLISERNNCADRCYRNLSSFLREVDNK